ncbi:MAG: squalene--hopene cyclase, partial [Candidatus Hydrogenedentes bacterium]|nr:squalene--hopene cyclase [Candidatus Hydrogenedentota bacterium]
SWFHRLGLPVVSYALPALIAIGQAQHHHNPTRNPVRRFLRNWVRPRTLRLLTAIQPDSGGFLEATPLTSFVTMSLLQGQSADHPVIKKSLAFLIASAREDGSWPIDSNLCVWVSTLSIKALAQDTPSPHALTEAEREKLLRWLLDQQLKSTHTYTLAAPGGWAWTDLAGGVPDADDTAGALLALHALAPQNNTSIAPNPEIQKSAEAGVRWLLDLQNRDGGIPTFCRGWGLLPFDMSSPDLTAHALRAILAWRNGLPKGMKRPTDRTVLRGIRFLTTTQCGDGTWLPLWFGNQSATEQHNPLYGTSQVLRSPDLPPNLLDADTQANWACAREKALQWLLAAQDHNGGWGGAAGVKPSIEETALAVETLATCLASSSRAVVATRSQMEKAIRRGCDWLIANTEGGTRFEPTPIGLYFANLWYHEQLYPLAFTVGALTQAHRTVSDPALPREVS